MFKDVSGVGPGGDPVKGFQTQAVGSALYSTGAVSPSLPDLQTLVLWPVEAEMDGDPQMSKQAYGGRMVYTVGDWLAVALVTIIIVIIMKWLHPSVGSVQFLFFLLCQTCLLTQLPRLQKASLHFHLQNQYEIPRGLV